MAYDEELANRVRELVQDEPGLTEKLMFGGLAFLVNGNMAVAASGQGGLLLRVDPARSEALVRRQHVERMQTRGREMAGWLRIGTAGVDDEEALRNYVVEGIEYARSLRPK